MAVDTISSGGFPTSNADRFRKRLQRTLLLLSDLHYIRLADTNHSQLLLKSKGAGEDRPTWRPNFTERDVVEIELPDNLPLLDYLRLLNVLEDTVQNTMTDTQAHALSSSQNAVKQGTVPPEAEPLLREAITDHVHTAESGMEALKHAAAEKPPTLNTFTDDAHEELHACISQRHQEALEHHKGGHHESYHRAITETTLLSRYAQHLCRHNAPRDLIANRGVQSFIKTDSAHAAAVLLKTVYNLFQQHPDFQATHQQCPSTTGTLSLLFNSDSSSGATFTLNRVKFTNSVG